MQKIVVGVDGSKRSLRALAWAAAEARVRGAALVVVHAWELTYAAAAYPVPTMAYDTLAMEKSADALLTEALGAVDTSGLVAPVQRVLVEGAAGGALLREAASADLLVVGARGHGGFVGLLLGSVSNQVAHHAPCPVVIVPDAD